MIETCFLFILCAVILSVGSANQVSPSGVRAKELIARAQAVLRNGNTKNLLAEDAPAEGGLSNLAIGGIVVGGTLFVALTGYIIYRYRTWVPRTRAARGKPGTDSSPSSPSSADDRQRLLVAGTTNKQ